MQFKGMNPQAFNASKGFGLKKCGRDVMKITQLINKCAHLMVALTMVTAVGCSQGFQAEESLVNSASRIEDDALAKELELGITAADADLVNNSLKEALDALQNVDQLSPGSATSGSASGLKGVIERVFGLLFDNLGVVKDKIHMAREKILAQMARLNPALPIHAEAIARMQELLDHLDQFETKIDVAVEKVLSKIERVFDRIDDVIARLDPGKVPHLVAIVALESLKYQIEEVFNEMVARYRAS